MLNDLYLTEWRFYLNFFIPSFKLIEKRRTGAKIIKIFDPPLTPYQRLINSEFIKPAVKKQLTQTFRSLDPFSLEKKLKSKIKNILKLY